MASLIKRREHWYARVKWRTSESKWQKIKEVPLKTKAKVVARERLVEVNKVESDIKDGINFDFGRGNWNNFPSGS